MKPAQLRLLENDDLPAKAPSPKQIVIQIGDPIITLERFCQMQGGTVSLRTLEDQARKGLLAGAHKSGNKWWINMLARVQQGLEWSGEDSGQESQTANPTPPAPRPWRSPETPTTGRDMEIPRAQTQDGPPPRARYRS